MSNTTSSINVGAAINQTTKHYEVDNIQFRNSKIFTAGKAILLCILFVLMNQAAIAQVPTTAHTYLSSKQALFTANTHRNLLPATEITVQGPHVKLPYKTTLNPSKRANDPVNDIHAKNERAPDVKSTDLPTTILGNLELIHVQPINLETVKETDITISGTVTDAKTGNPLVGVNILVVGTSTGGITDTNGHYSIEVPSLQDTLRFSFIGYETRTVPINGRTTINIELKSSVKSLSQLVVTATGVTNIEKLGTSISSVGTKDFNASTITSTQAILAGNIEGAIVLPNSGQPGAGGTIRLRGNNSITQSNSPIVYLNGIRIKTGFTTSNGETSQSVNPLNYINPSDIKKITVVQGPAAATLYGSDASGGVIRITTKQGHANQTIWNVGITEGFNNIGHFGPDENNPTGLFIGKCRGEGLVTIDGEHFQERDCPDSGSWLRNGLVQNYHLSVSSGVEDFTYYLSADYINEKGVLFHGGKNKKIGISGNFDYSPTNNLTLTYYTSLDRQRIKWVPQGNDGDAFLLNATRGPHSRFAGATGCANPTVTCVANSQMLNLLHNRELSFQYNNSLKIKLHTKQLHNRVIIGLNYLHQRHKNTKEYGYRRDPKGMLFEKMYSHTTLSLDYLGTYRLAINDDINVKLNWGAQFYRTKNSNVHLLSRHFSGPQKPVLTSGSVTGITFDDFRIVAKGGVFGQASFGFFDKLYVVTGLRYDHNSTFGSNFGWQLYPKINASYILSKYDFWPTSWWNHFRIRAALGEAGQPPSPFQVNRTYAAISGENGKPGLSTEQSGNPNLGPEVTREIEVGFNAGFFNNRLTLDFTYYNQKTRNLIVPVPNVPSKGFLGTQERNVGTAKNTGIEISLNAQIIRSSIVDWQIETGFATHNSRVLSLGGFDQITIGWSERTFVRPGYPLPAIFGLKIINPHEKADPVYTDEMVYYGPAYPDKTINMGTSLHLIHGISLNARGIINLGGYMVNGVGLQNSRRGVWSPCYPAGHRDISNVSARLRAKCSLGGVFGKTDDWIEPTDYFRLKNLSLTYSVSDKLLPDDVRSMSITLAAKNIFTITTYSGTDPSITTETGSLERRDYYAMPTNRTFLVALNFSF